MNTLDDSANKDRCTLYEDSANFFKDERFTKTEYQTERWTPRTHETPRELGRQSAPNVSKHFKVGQMCVDDDENAIWKQPRL